LKLLALLLAQIGGAAVDSVYATTALRRMIERAALVNHSGPVWLGGYRAMDPCVAWGWRFAAWPAVTP
jgi:hypothetical protein